MTAAILGNAPRLRPVWVDEAGVPVAIGDTVVTPPRGDLAAVRQALLALAGMAPPDRRHPRHPDDHQHPPEPEPEPDDDDPVPDDAVPPERAEDGPEQPRPDGPGGAGGTGRARRLTGFLTPGRSRSSRRPVPENLVTDPAEPGTSARRSCCAGRTRPARPGPTGCRPGCAGSCRSGHLAASGRPAAGGPSGATWTTTGPGRTARRAPATSGRCAGSITGASSS